MLRINILLNPHKDDALYKLMAAIPKDARARRLINMASIGSLIGNNSSSNFQPTNSTQLSSTLNNTPTDSSQKEQVTKELQFAEGELDALGSMFDV